LSFVRVAVSSAETPPLDAELIIRELVTRTGTTTGRRALGSIAIAVGRDNGRNKRIQGRPTMDRRKGSLAVAARAANRETSLDLPIHRDAGSSHPTPFTLRGAGRLLDNEAASRCEIWPAARDHRRGIPVESSHSTGGPAGSRGIRGRFRLLVGCYCLSPLLLLLLLLPLLIPRGKTVSRAAAGVNGKRRRFATIGLFYRANAFPGSRRTVDPVDLSQCRAIENNRRVQSKETAKRRALLLGSWTRNLFQVSHDYRYDHRSMR